LKCRLIDLRETHPDGDESRLVYVVREWVG
jgi:hypothetical protein